MNGFLNEINFSLAKCKLKWKQKEIIMTQRSGYTKKTFTTTQNAHNTAMVK